MKQFVYTLLGCLLLIVSGVVDGQQSPFPFSSVESSVEFSLEGKIQGRITSGWMKKNPKFMMDYKIWAKPQQYWPIQIEFSTTKDCSIQGVINWQHSTDTNYRNAQSYHVSFVAPAQAHQKVSGYIPLPTSLENIYPQILFYENGNIIGQLALTELFPDRIALQSDELILVLTSEQSFQDGEHNDFNLITSFLPRKVVWAEAMYFPDHSSALSKFSAIVLDNLISDLSDWNTTQWQSLLGYISQGGKIYVCAGCNDVYLKNHRWQEILPVSLLEMKKIQEGNIQFTSASQQDIRLNWIPITDVPLQLRCSQPLKGANVHVRLNEYPLVVTKAYGLGQIIFIATSFCDPYWKSVQSGLQEGLAQLSAKSTFPTNIQRKHCTLNRLLWMEYLCENFHGVPQCLEDVSNQANLIENKLYQQAGFVSVPFLWIFWIILAYFSILIVFFFTFLRRKKYVLAWIFSTVWAVFCGFIFWMYIQNSITFPMVANGISFFHSKTNSLVANVYHSFSLVSRNTQPLALNMEQERYIILAHRQNIHQSLAYPMQMNENIAYSIQKLNTVNSFLYSATPHHFTVHGQDSFPENWKGKISIEQGKMNGYISNPTDCVWENAWIIFDEQMYHIGEICKGESKSFQGYFSRYSFDQVVGKMPEYDQKIIASIRPNLDNIVKGWRVYLLAFSDVIENFLAQSPVPIHWNYQISCLLLEIDDIEFIGNYISQKKDCKIPAKIKNEYCLELPFHEMLSIPIIPKLKCNVVDVYLNTSQRSQIEAYHFYLQKSEIVYIQGLDGHRRIGKNCVIIGNHLICPLTRKIWLWSSDDWELSDTISFHCTFSE